MTLLGTITQLPKDFFLHAVTLAGASTENTIPSEQAEVDAADLKLASGEATVDSRHDWQHLKLSAVLRAYAITCPILQS